MKLFSAFLCRWTQNGNRSLALKWPRGHSRCFIFSDMTNVYTTADFLHRRTAARNRKWKRAPKPELSTRISLLLFYPIRTYFFTFFPFSFSLLAMPLYIRIWNHSQCNRYCISIWMSFRLCLHQTYYCIS